MTNSDDTEMGLGHPWYETLKELEAGEFPSKEGLEFGLRSDKLVPTEVRKFLAKLVSGEVKAPMGRPQRSWLDRELTANRVRALYEFMKELVDNDKAAGDHLGDKPSEIALIRTQQQLAAEGENWSLESVRDIVYRRNGWKSAGRKVGI